MKLNKKLRFYEQNKLDFWYLPFNLWTILATWLHLGARQKLHEK
jgi:hypothetical protein